MCMLHKEGVCVSDVLWEMIDNRVYKSDYVNITMGLLFVPENYEMVIHSLQKTLDSGMWE